MPEPLSAVSGDSPKRRPIKTEASLSSPKFDAENVPPAYLGHRQPSGGKDSYVKDEQDVKHHYGQVGSTQSPISHPSQAGRAAGQQMKGEEEKPNLPDIGHNSKYRLHEYLEKIKIYCGIDGRYPLNQEVYVGFKALKRSYRSAADALPYVSRLLKGAPELVQEFVQLQHVFNAHYFQSTPPMPSDSSSAHPMLEHSHALIDARQERERVEIQELLSLPEIDIPKTQRKQTPPTMLCNLLEHQKACLSWLMQQELNVHKKGGLLADEMGLGKTIEALSLIMARPSRDPARKTTLIVAPVALLSQWRREIETKVKPQFRLKTLILHGPRKRAMTVSRLLSYDVVITTYGTIASENQASRNRKATRRPLLLASDAWFYRIILDEAHNIKSRTSNRSEAVCRLKSTYKLCMTGTPFMNNIAEIYPIIRFLNIAPYRSWERFNDDIVKPVDRWDEDERSEAMLKLRALFRSITLRRTKDSVLDGKKIINLPPLSVEITAAKFDESQKEFYDALESKQQLKFNEYSKAGISKHYAHIFVLLLRLRQVCCHPHLIKDVGIPDGAQLDPKDMFDLARKLNARVVERIKSRTSFHCPMCQTETENPIIIYPCGHDVCGACFTGMMEMGILGNCLEDAPHPECPQYGCDSTIEPGGVICYNFFQDAHTDNGPEDNVSGEYDSEEDDVGSESEDDADERGNLKDFVVSDEDAEDREEDVADDESDEEVATSCTGLQISQNSPGKSVSPAPLGDDQTGLVEHHETAQEDSADDSDGSDDSLPTLKQLQERARARAEKNKANVRPKVGPKTGTQLAAMPSVKRKRTADDTRDKPIKKQKRNDKRKATGTKSLGAIKGASRSAAAKATYLEYLRKKYVSSAKIDKTMELLREIREQHPGEKTLVFGLWTSFLDLLEIPIHDQGFGYRRYDGGMRPRERDAAVRDFMERSGVNVLLVSLMAGNAGLNLTAASRVIVLEPFWNPYVESQAVDRAHRIGQKRPVTVHRVLIAGTVEDRIQELQEKKRRLVSAALSEEGAQSMSRLSLSELRGLFGVR